MAQSSTSSHHQSYDPEYFLPLFKAEDQHFWFRARNSLIRAFARQVMHKAGGDFRLLEIGCGTGNVLQHLESLGDRQMALGMDLFREGLLYARHRVSCPLVQADLSAPPFKEKFDLVGLFDVLEHIPNDKKVLSDLRFLLDDHGVLMITVPAFSSLWSYFDEASHHVRRYQREELAQKLTEAGYQVDYIGYYMTSIFPLVWLSRKAAVILRKRKGGESEKNEHDLALEELKIVPIVNEILAWILKVEIRLIEKGFRMPFGTSLVALARKRN